MCWVFEAQGLHAAKGILRDMACVSVYDFGIRKSAMARIALALVLSAVLAPPCLAADEAFSPLRDRAVFLDFLADRQLHIGLYDLSLRVTPDGRIAGSALGWDITGSWTWQDGYFCREMDWSGTEIAPNCQLVEARGDNEMRFTVDRGAGRSARFKLR
jgi:hypothetical protein